MLILCGQKLVIQILAIKPQMTTLMGGHSSSSSSYSGTSIPTSQWHYHGNPWLSALKTSLVTSCVEPMRPIWVPTE